MSWFRSSKKEVAQTEVQLDFEADNKVSSENLLLLRQVVHPLFTEMSEPQVQITMDKLAKRMTCSDDEDLDMAVAELASKMAEELRHPQDDITEINACVFHSAEVFWAAMSVAMQTVGLDCAPRLRLKVRSSFDERTLIDSWKLFQYQASLEVTECPEWGPVDEKDGYMWIRQDGTSLACLERLAAAFVSIRRAWQLPSVSEMISGTKLLLPSTQTPTWPGKRMTKLWHSSDSVMDTAAKKALQGLRVVAVNGGSAYQVGSAFLTGGPHALEEALCTQSSLFLSLQHAQRLANDFSLLDAKGQPVHIPESGAVLSPNVEIFRQGVAFGYAPAAAGTVMLAGVVTVAMPNMNPEVAHTPVEWRKRAQREQLIERKMNAMLQGAEMVTADVVVVSDIGCGKFGNDPRLIGAALGVVLSRYPGHFAEVAITGSVRFFDAVCEGVGPGFVVAHKESPTRSDNSDSFSTASTRASTDNESPTGFWNFAKKKLFGSINIAERLDTQTTMPRRGTGAHALVIGRQDFEMNGEPVVQGKVVGATKSTMSQQGSMSKVAPRQSTALSTTKQGTLSTVQQEAAVRSKSSEPRKKVFGDSCCMATSLPPRRSSSVGRRGA